MVKIKWMTELPERCDHPEDCLSLHFDILDQPYWDCKKCNRAISKEEKNHIDTLRTQSKLVI